MGLRALHHVVHPDRCSACLLQSQIQKVAVQAVGTLKTGLGYEVVGGAVGGAVSLCRPQPRPHPEMGLFSMCTASFSATQTWAA